MNREIKFRGKSKKDGKWLYGYLGESKVRILNTEYLEKVIFNNVLSFNSDNYPFIVKDISVDPNTVGQYTGLKDKNGKEIYEGDIMFLSDRGSHKEEVIVEHGLYGWTFYNPKTSTFYSDGSHTYCAIENYRFMFGTGVCIGNIHDNPELLNTK